MDCSVGVMAYNEQANIADAIGSILDQKLTSRRITELIVVASGCQDRTVAIVAGIARRDPRVRLIEQERREGKASAVNLFISAARSPVLAQVRARADMRWPELCPRTSMCGDSQPPQGRADDGRP